MRKANLRKRAGITSALAITILVVAVSLAGTVIILNSGLALNKGPSNIENVTQPNLIINGTIPSEPKTPLINDQNDSRNVEPDHQSSNSKEPTIVEGNSTKQLSNFTRARDIIQYPELPASYIVWLNGSTYYAKDGHTGAETNNTVAEVLIQAVCNTLTGGGIIDIKAGTYPILSGLTVYPNTWVRGEGCDRTILLFTGASGYCISAKSQATVQNHIKITDLNIHVTAVNAGAIDFKAVSRGVIRDCYIANTNPTGMSTNTSRIGIRLYQSGDTAGGYFNIIDNVSLWQWYAGIDNVNGNVMSMNGGDIHACYIGIYLENPSQCVITNPDLEGNNFGLDVASHFENTLIGGYYEVNITQDILMPSGFGILHAYGLPASITTYISAGATSN